MSSFGKGALGQVWQLVVTVVSAPFVLSSNLFK